jgi:hypothetical protein
MKDLTQGPVSRLLVQMAVPATASASSAGEGG